MAISHDRTGLTESRRVPRGLAVPGALLAARLAVAVAVAGAPAPSRAAVPPVLEAEQSDVATLPPFAPHWVLPPTARTAYTLYDADAGRILGTIPAGIVGNIALSPDRRSVYVADTIWSRVDHGTRQDLLQEYDARTLSLRREITLPPRALAVYQSRDFALSADGRWAYSFNMSPATSVTVVDLAHAAVARTVDIPGCALVYPWKSGGFSSLCGDGSLTNVGYDGGKPTVTHTTPFFDANTDPIFEGAPVDRATGHALFVSYTGKVYDAALGQAPVIAAPWSIQQAAGQPAAGTGVQELAWRPGGSQPFAWNRATGHLFVLMHTGTYWTHKNPGTEVWELDPARHALVRRIDLPAPARGIAVSADAAPLLYAAAQDGTMAVIDVRTGTLRRSIEAQAGPMLLAPDL
ncbi:amine dehydrogenase large subunit [Gluconacetobacter diazotrophicus]|uniref:Methylamine dehydrogenase heavy chain n=2 Tax=Gluconacetobacter diazotrophicus TaxID=33996 RepID=A9H2X8_GLUDA|nr:amine dehydrogenase large subunit [Gluconacetobacter diazotrophicus]MBB2156963.1 amine dehydrogenase [Gluconacetobacter diazotrophicus]CAP54214.1 Methylamine dehydrogenase heavy chain precursor [Gluconacetobacter diazotrophicus PA1 5]